MKRSEEKRRIEAKRRGEKRKENSREEKEVDCLARNNTFIFTTGDRKFTALKFPVQCPLALVVTVGGKQGTALEIEEGRIMGGGFLDVYSRET